MILLPNEDTFGRRFMTVTEETPNIIDESTEGVLSRKDYEESFVNEP